MQETRIWSLGWEDPLEKEMATHSSILALRIPWRDEPGRLRPRSHKESDTTELLHFHFQDFCFTVGMFLLLFSCVQLFATPWTVACQLPCPSPTLTVCSNSCPLSQWCHPTISSSVDPFSSRLQSFPASGSFLMSWLLIWSSQSTGASASAAVLPMSI